MKWLLIILAAVVVVGLLRFAKKGGCGCGPGKSTGSEGGEKKEGGCCSH